MRAEWVSPSSQNTPRETNATCGMSICAAVASRRCSERSSDVDLWPDAAAQQKIHFALNTKRIAETFIDKIFFFTLSNEVNHVF